VSLIPVLSDNYVFVLHGGSQGGRGRSPSQGSSGEGAGGQAKGAAGQAVVVDPAVAGPVIHWLEQHGLELEAVLQTHHHSDHIGGTPGLLRRWPQAAVVAAGADRERIPLQTVAVGDGDRLTLLEQELTVMAVPGHTRHHLAFHVPGIDALFCGDTLFAGGCGRLFEGTAEQMHNSLQRLAALPAATQVWCAHEYTEANLRWAAAQRPADGAIAARLAEVRRLRFTGQPTIPRTVALERRLAAIEAEVARLTGLIERMVVEGKF
jgi:hydroxyacylglutathione hydrolase